MFALYDNMQLTTDLTYIADSSMVVCIVKYQQITVKTVLLAKIIPAACTVNMYRSSHTTKPSSLANI